MKRYKKVAVLAALLVVICIATFAMTRYEEKQEQIRTSDEIILQIPREDVRSLSWDYSDGSGLGFNYTGDAWAWQEDAAFPVSEDKIMDILSHFEDFGVTFAIEEVTDFGQYGLDDPEAILHLETETQSYDIRLGDFSKMDQQRYIDIGDGNVYLVSEDPMDYISADLSVMILHDDTPDFDTVVDITFAGEETGTITRVEGSTDTYAPGEDVYFVEQNGETVPLDTANVQKFLSIVTALNLTDYVTYNVTEDELKAYGLDEPALSVTINYTYPETTADGEEITAFDTCVLHLSENPEERSAADAAIEQGENPGTVTKYVRIGDSQIVYKVDNTDYAILTAVSYDDLRHTEVFWADFDTVTQIDIALEGMEHTLISCQDGDDQRIWYYLDEEVVIVPTEEASQSTEETEATEECEELDISDFQNALYAMTADSFTDEVSDQVEEIGLTLHLDNENYPTVEIRLYRYDGSLCLAVVDGEPVSLVSRSTVMALVEAVQTIVLNR